MTNAELMQWAMDLPCYAARPGEQSYECRADSLCPACQMRLILRQFKDGPWTADRVRQLLGLKDWDEMYLDAVKLHLAGIRETGKACAVKHIKDGRRSGKTTKIICEAVAYILSTGKPVGFFAGEIYAANARAMAANARDMLEDLGYGHLRCLVGHIPERNSSIKDPLKVFSDHHYSK